MEKTTALPRPELVLTADSVAREKGITKEQVFEAMEQAIAKAAKTKYGFENDIQVHIDPKNGAIYVRRQIEVVATDADVLNEHTQISLKKAKKYDSEAAVGGFVSDPLPPIDFGRMSSQTAKQIIVQKVRDAERTHQYEEFKDKIGDITNGIIRRIEYGNVYVDLGRGEGVLQRNEVIPQEPLHPGDRIRAYIMDVRSEARGPQVFLSRTHPQFMARLFAQEVPEIYDGIIEIKAVARDPGSRAKIAVASQDASLDPVGSCVGMRGSRVLAVINELQGEKIDIIPWSHDIATFAIHALTPAKIAKVVVDEESHRLDVVVPEDQLSLAIGRRGQNVRLASMLTSWHIDILTEDQESARRQEDFKTKSALFIKALDVDEVIAHLLVTEGFRTLEEVAFVPPQELSSIEGFDENLAHELQTRAKNYLDEQKATREKELKALKIEASLSNFSGLSHELLLKLGEKGIRTLDDLADLASDELIEIAGADLSPGAANRLIISAREHWFKEESAEITPDAATPDKH